MGFYYGTRLPYEVQRDNGKRFDFDTVAKHYEETKPLRGKRSKFDVRPIGERNRCWERVVKVSDTEYFITCRGYVYNDETAEKISRRKSITFRRDGDLDTVIVHAPRNYWLDTEGEAPLTNNGLSSPSYYFFYDFNLPIGLGMDNYRSAKYVKVQTEDGDKFYTLNKGDVTVTRKIGEKYWKPLVVHRESTHTIDRKQSKEIRNKAKEFVEYAKVMADIIPDTESSSTFSYWIWQTNPFTLGSSGSTAFDDLRDSFKGMSWEENLCKVNDDIPDHWFNLLKIYRKRSECHMWNNETRTYEVSFSSKKMVDHLYRDLYKVAKPLKEKQVPLGERCKDKFKNWYN